ncbi:uncharacterized protein [Epargyreus clarus]|uniref:uncharacterized protein n=1 Tax=Epargyreus clarus TaxID=520877 RepID=UPI003C2DEF11
MFKSLRKYGLEYCDLPTMIDNVSFLLKIWTVDIQRNGKQRVPTYMYFITILTGACYFYVYVVSMLWFVFIRCRETGDMVSACVIFSIGACSLTGVAKLIYMRLTHNNFSDTIKNIVDEYLTCDALVEPGTRFSSNLLKALRVVKWRAMSFWLFLTINGFIYVAIPIVLPGRHFSEDLYVIYGLEPMFETPNYQIAFAIMTAGVYFGIPPETNTSAFLTILSGYAEAQMLALSEELNNLWDDATAYHQDLELGTNQEIDKTLNEYIQRKLRDIAMKHIMTKNLLSRIETMFLGVIAVKFGFLILALIAELLGGLENTYVQLPYTLLQVAMDCFRGQRLIDASLVLENAIYCCKWECFNESNQKTIYLMLMNLQKTQTLSAGGLAVLSYACFMSVLKSIYSAFTALRSRI